ncbi:MAG: hypothetical protein ACOY58_01795 [Candidatus Micrarchaeota archaeon]
MGYHWAEETTFKRVELEPEERDCEVCHGSTHICDHRHHKIHTLCGPVHIVSKLTHCADVECPGHAKTVSADAEMQLTMPWWSIGWDVFAWIGHRRFGRHWSVSQIRMELQDSYDIVLSDDAIEGFIRRYQTMVAAREQDPRQLAAAYRDVKDLILSIDGLQPEKGHETLYVVRELRCKRVWFAESLISSSREEVRRLIGQAREWAERLEIPVSLWISDKQDAFVDGIAEEFPGVPHRYCQNHFLRDVAKPVLEADSQAKVKMRKRVRGLRSVERKVLESRREREVWADGERGKQRQGEAPEAHCHGSGRAALAARQGCTMEDSGVPDRSGNAACESKTDAEQVVLDYCTAVRGILNDDQGGPLHPPGMRMAESLQEVRASLQRNLEAKKGAMPRSVWSNWPAALIVDLPK